MSDTLINNIHIQSSSNVKNVSFLKEYCDYFDSNIKLISILIDIVQNNLHKCESHIDDTIYDKISETKTTFQHIYIMIDKLKNNNNIYASYIIKKYEPIIRIHLSNFINYLNNALKKISSNNVDREKSINLCQTINTTIIDIKKFTGQSTEYIININNKDDNSNNTETNEKKLLICNIITIKIKESLHKNVVQHLL